MIARLRGWVREWLDWWNARNQGPVRGLVACLHPTPPGFTKCKAHRAFCLTCGQKFKC